MHWLSECLIVPGSQAVEHNAKAFQVFLVIIAENPVDSPYIVSQFMKTFVNRKICGHNYLSMEDSVIF